MDQLASHVGRQLDQAFFLVAQLWNAGKFSDKPSSPRLAKVLNVINESMHTLSKDFVATRKEEG